MSNKKHTPGPWKNNTEFHLYKHDAYYNIVAGDGFIDDTLGMNGFNITGIMVDADAKLIAAAPELLELAELLDVDDRFLNEFDNMDQLLTQVRSWAAKARVAIKKATE